jgi:hypothetical protein
MLIKLEDFHEEILAEMIIGREEMVGEMKAPFNSLASKIDAGL